MRLVLLIFPEKFKEIAQIKLIKDRVLSGGTKGTRITEILPANLDDVMHRIGWTQN